MITTQQFINSLTSLNSIQMILKKYLIYVKLNNKTMTMQTKFKFIKKSKLQKLKLLMNNITRGAGYAIRN